MNEDLERVEYACGCVRSYPRGKAPERCETCNAGRVPEGTLLAKRKG